MPSRIHAWDVLRAAAIAAALQADADDGGLTTATTRSVKCFRDEDLRADRQPEFTQIDVEMSFLDEIEIREIMEGLVCTMFRDALGVESAGPVSGDAVSPTRCATTARTNPTSAYRVEAHRADRPHENRGLQGVPHGRRPAEQGASPRCRVPGGGTLTRKEIDDYTTFVKIYGAAGLAYIKVNDAAKPNEEGLQSPIVKFLSGRCAGVRSSSARERRRATSCSSPPTARKVVNDSLGALRAKRRQRPRLRRSPDGNRSGSIDFPMFEYDDDRKSWSARHHPFTAPKDGHETLFETDPGRAIAKAYDVVMNGWEIGGGSVRIHKPEVQAKVFAALRISPEDQRKKFGFLLDALSYGAPPHGGIAFGLDRLVAMMAGVDQIRDVIAFPKTQRGQDLLVDAPSAVTEQQLRDLHIKVRASDSIRPAG